MKIRSMFSQTFEYSSKWDGKYEEHAYGIATEATAEVFGKIFQ